MIELVDLQVTVEAVQLIREEDVSSSCCFFFFIFALGLLPFQPERQQPASLLLSLGGGWNVPVRWGDASRAEGTGARR